MAKYYREWWAEEIDEKFKYLMKLLGVFYWTVLIYKPIMMYLKPDPSTSFYQVTIIIIVVLLTSLGKYIANASPYYKIAYALVVTENMNYFSFKIAEVNLKDHEPAFLFVSTIILVCLQLPFIYDYKLMALLIIKFEAQWYLQKLYTGEIQISKVTTPYSAMIGAVLFYYFFRHFQNKSSYNLFKSEKKIKLIEAKNSALLKAISDGLVVFSPYFSTLFSNENITKYFNTDENGLLESIQNLNFLNGKNISNLSGTNSLFEEIKAAAELPDNTEHSLGLTRIGDNC